MLASSRTLQSWMAPVLGLSGDRERQAALSFLRLDRCFSLQPQLLRRLSDRSCSVDVRRGWMMEALDLTSDSEVMNVLSRLLSEGGFTLWTKFFYEYLRIRERLGYGKMYLVLSSQPLPAHEAKMLEKKLETRFSEPATIYALVDSSVRAGFRVESPDGWQLDASVEGRLNRLALVLAS